MTVYILQPKDGGPIKIGQSGAPRIREKQISQLFPYGVDILCLLDGGFQTENFLHLCFRPISISQEWFRPCTAIWQFLIDVEKFGRPAFLPDESLYLRAEVMAQAEFGSKAEAMSALGYSPTTAFGDAFGGGGGNGGKARLAWALAMRDGTIPDYIKALHIPAPMEAESAA